MATTAYARTIRVRGAFNPECNLFALTCDELPGLFLAGSDLKALQEDVPNVIRALYRLDCGLEVNVEEVNHAPRSQATHANSNFIDLFREFVAKPAAIAAHA